MLANTSLCTINDDRWASEGYFEIGSSIKWLLKIIGSQGFKWFYQNWFPNLKFVFFKYLVFQKVILKKTVTTITKLALFNIDYEDG